MEVGQIIALLSGAGIGAILSAILVFINTSKKKMMRDKNYKMLLIKRHKRN